MSDKPTEEQKTPDPVFKTHAQRVAETQEAAQKKEQAEKEKAQTPRAQMDKSDYEFGKRMLPLITNPSFQAWDEFVNLQIVKAMQDPYSRPAPAMFDTTNNNRAEWVAFKQGFLQGMAYLRRYPKHLFEMVLKHDEAEAQKEKNNQSKGE